MTDCNVLDICDSSEEIEDCRRQNQAWGEIVKFNRALSDVVGRIEFIEVRTRKGYPADREFPAESAEVRESLKGHLTAVLDRLNTTD